MILIYVGIFLIAGSILMLEIALTRVFAIMLWHHLTYMVVSVALLGFGAAGSILTERESRLAGASTPRALALFATLYGLAVIAAFCIATQLPLNALELWANKLNLVKLGVLYVTIAAPFLFGGLAIGLALARFPSQVHRVYFVDLLGSAVGGSLSIWILGHFSSSATVIFAGTIGILSGFVFAMAANRGTALACVPVVAFGVLASIAMAGGARWLGIPAVTWNVPYAPGKEFAEFPPDAGVARLPSATAEVEVTRSATLPPIAGGEFGRVDQRWVEGRAVGQDGTAPTLLYKNAAQLDDLTFLDDSQTAAPYVAQRARGASDPTVLVIGVGGGIDVMIALAHDARRVTAVEINRAMIELVRDRFDDYLGGLFRPNAHSYSDRIELRHGEGRAFARGSTDRYDVIQLAGVDSFTALSTGAYTLSESYLYTVEAIRDFYGRLNDEGYLSFSRFILQYPQKPRETLRLSNIVRAALGDLGVADPASQILVFQAATWASTVVKRGPFTEPEVLALERFAEKQGFWGLVFDPLGRPAPPYHPGVEYDRWAELAFKEVVTDHALAELMAWPEEQIAAALAAAYRLRVQGQQAPAEEAVRALLARLPASGAGVASATAAIQKALDTSVANARFAEERFARSRGYFDEVLRGTPQQRAAFVAAYEYDISPATDDAPFFFNYYRYGGLLRSANAERTPSRFDVYHPDYPVGHMVLLSSLGQIMLLAVVLILLPLRRLARRGIHVPQRWRVLLYFAALGTGFMFIEIALMQKMVLFLGHPTYAVSVVLTVLLASAGIGAFTAGWIKVPRGALPRLLASIIGVLALVFVATTVVLPTLFGMGFASRVAVVTAVLSPLGFVLGMPFPIGIRILNDTWPQLIPWAWAVNGFLSVFASIFSVVLAMMIGFQNVLIVAGAVYAIGVLAFMGMPPATQTPRS